MAIMLTPDTIPEIYAEAPSGDRAVTSTRSNHVNRGGTLIIRHPGFEGTPREWKQARLARKKAKAAARRRAIRTGQWPPPVTFSLVVPNPRAGMPIVGM